MKTETLLASAVTFGFLCPAWAGPTKSPQPSTATDPANRRICARVNGAPIYEEEVKQKCQVYLQMIESMPESERSQRLRERAREELDNLIDREILVHATLEELRSDPVAVRKLWKEARQDFVRQMAIYKDLLSKQGMEVNDEQVRKLIQAQGIDFEMLRRTKEREYVAFSYLEMRISPRLNLRGEAKNTIERLVADGKCRKRVFDRIMPGLKQKAHIEIFTERIDNLAMENNP